MAQCASQQIERSRMCLDKNASQLQEASELMKPQIRLATIPSIPRVLVRRHSKSATAATEQSKDAARLPDGEGREHARPDLLSAPL